MFSQALEISAVPKHCMSLRNNSQNSDFFLRHFPMFFHLPFKTLQSLKKSPNKPYVKDSICPHNGHKIMALKASLRSLQHRNRNAVMDFGWDLAESRLEKQERKTSG